MANLSAIKLPNGTTYNLVDKTSGYTKNTGTITSIKTTAGAHTTIDVSSGAATFNVPTKTSHLTNDSGYITSYTDEKLTVRAEDSNAYYPILSTSSSTASTKYYSNLLYLQNYGDLKALSIGGTTSDSVKTGGALRLYNAAGGSVTLSFDSTPTYNRAIIIPNQAGENVTLATLNDIPSVPTKVSQLTNDSGFITSYTDTNTTYTLSGALSSHKFTSTLTAGGSGSGTSTSVLTLAAGSNVTLTDNTSTKTITIAATDTKYSAGAGLSLSSTTFSSLNSNLVNGSGSYSLQMDNGAIAGGLRSFAEGSSETTGNYSHAEGYQTLAYSNNSHSEGYNTEARGVAAHVEGYYGMASGDYSHAQNWYTIAQGKAQTTIGKYNIAQGNTDFITSADYALIIGNGTSNTARSNALTVDWSGNVDFSGKATDSTGNTLTPSVELTQAEYDALTTEEKNNGTVYYITDGQPEKYIVNDSVPIGAIQAYGGATAPANWLMCDGSAVSRTTYSELFSAIGTTFGEGDGSTTFNLPDLRGRTAIGSGLGTASDAVERNIGQAGGSERVTLTTAQIPSHTHGYQKPVLMWGSGANAAWPGSGTTAKGSDQWGYSGVANTGGGESHGNMPPYVATNYIIKAKDHSVLQADLLPMLDLFYPVGCYFETSDSSFDPNVSIGGTWTGNTSSDNELIEEGASGIWTYRKWSNGIAECWGTYSKSIAANTVDISNYITYPFTFTSKPFITTGLQGGGADLYRGHVEPAQTNASQVRLVLINKHTAAVTIYMGMHAIGTWKTYTTPTITYKWHRTT